MSESVLAIDPGSRALGYGVLDYGGVGLYRARRFGVLRYSGEVSFNDRLLSIFLDVSDLIRETSPSWVALEKAFLGESPDAAMKLGAVRASVIIAARGAELELVEITPAEAKRSVTGNGRSSKEQVRDIVGQVLGLDLAAPLDASDALAIGLACLYRRETGAALNEKPPRARGSRKRWTAADLAGFEVSE